MRAIQFTAFGGPEQLQLVETPAPVAGPGEIVLRQRAIGVNFADTLIRQAKYPATPPLPAVPGSESAGEIVEIGPGVEGFSIGQRVAAPLFAAGAVTGAYAEYAVLPAALAVPLPDDVAFETAAALQVQGLSALHLVRQANPAGKQVLITAAAGGVGSLLLQLARAAGARKVIAAASSRAKLDLALELGADAAINYTDAGWRDALRAATEGAGPDLIYESVGGAMMMECLAALAPLGQIMVYGALNIQNFALGAPDLLGLIFKNQSLTGFALAPLLTPQRLAEDLRHLFDLVAAGKLRLVIGGVHRLEDAAEAHRALEQRATTGKLVLRP